MLYILVFLFNCALQRSRVFSLHLFTSISHADPPRMFLVLLISMAATNIEPFVAGQALGPACLLAIECALLLPSVCRYRTPPACGNYFRKCFCNHIFVTEGAGMRLPWLRFATL
jgi:hypothetical protein